MATVHQLNWPQRLGIAVGVFCFRLWAASWQIKLSPNAKKFFANQLDPQIALVWHNRLAMAVGAKFRYGRGMRLCALVSPSRDGAILSEILRHVGIAAARGSSNRRATAATRELVEAIEENHFCAAITPDGPLGPIYKLKDGLRPLVERYRTAIFIAKTANPILFKSWDRFQLPRLFAKVEIDFEMVPSSWEEVKERMAQSIE